MRPSKNKMSKRVWIGFGLLLGLVAYTLAFGAITTEGVPEFPFKNMAQLSGVPGWTQQGNAQAGQCGSTPVYMAQFVNPESQLIQVFTDMERRIVAGWYPDGRAQYPTHLWLGLITPENGKIVVGDPVLYIQETFPSPCVYWRGETGT